MSVPAAAVWADLGLSRASLSALSSAPSPSLTPDEVARALGSEAPQPSFAVASRRAARASVAAARAAVPAAQRATEKAPVAVAAFDALVEECDAVDAVLEACVREVSGLQEEIVESKVRRVEAERAAEHVEAFVEEVLLDPALVRHVVDGKVGEGKYVQCLGVLRKKVAVYDMRDTKRAAVYRQLKPVLDQLVATAAAKVRIFLLAKVDLLRRPNTNVNIIKENVLLRHSELALFLEELSPPDFIIVRDAYVHTMSSLYRALFTKYATALGALKVPIGADATVAALSGSSSAATIAVSGLSLSSAPLVGVVQDKVPGAAANAMASTSRSLSGLLGLGPKGKTVTTGSSQVRRHNSISAIAKPPSDDAASTGSYDRRSSIGSAVEATNASAAAAAAAMLSSTSLFSLGNRIDVLSHIATPAIVLAVAVDNDMRFYYEELHRSWGQMLAETWASEHLFCNSFFGDHARGMFHLLFDDVINTLLGAVTTHATASHDLIGCLLALKVNEAQRTSMQHRSILDLSHYFIRVDIALKPKFKRLFDMNIASLVAAAGPSSLPTLFGGESDTKPHAITRQFADLSASILAIAAYGATDDAIQEGLRRMRSEFVSFLTALSAQFGKQKSRYIFLINNVDLVVAMYASRTIESSSADMRFFNELQVGHTAAYVEQEVADHFPDLVSFVRDHDRRTRAASSSSASGSISAAPSDAYVRSVLREFASNWHLGVGHMRDSVLRGFPSFRAGNDILRALFARLFAYHRRCERIVNERYPTLKNELVSGTEISYEVRQLSNAFA